MSRGFPQALLDELNKKTISPIVIVELDTFNAALNQVQFVRAWSGVGSLIFQGNTFTGVGDFGGVQPLEEANDIKASSIQLSLSGVPSALISTALGNQYRNRPGKVWLALIDSSGQIVGSAIPFSGRIASMRISRGAETSTILVTMESVLADLERPRERRYTDLDQQQLFAGDKGLEFVAGFQNREIVWKS